MMWQKKSYRTVYVMGTQKELKPLPSFSPHKFQGDQDKLTTSVCSCTVLFVPVLACFQTDAFRITTDTASYANEDNSYVSEQLKYTEKLINRELWHNTTPI